MPPDFRAPRKTSVRKPQQLSPLFASLRPNVNGLAPQTGESSSGNRDCANQVPTISQRLIDNCGDAVEARNRTFGESRGVRFLTQFRDLHGVTACASGLPGTAERIDSRLDGGAGTDSASSSQARRVARFRSSRVTCRRGTDAGARRLAGTDSGAEVSATIPAPAKSNAHCRLIENSSVVPKNPGSRESVSALSPALPSTTARPACAPAGDAQQAPPRSRRGGGVESRKCSAMTRPGVTRTLQERYGPRPSCDNRNGRNS